MTNRSKSARSAKKSKLGLLDINFEGNEQTKTEPLENGKRPHGGYRGSKKHPISTYSFDKDSRYHKQLRNDIDRLFDEELYGSRGSPSWVINTSKEITHSGESPLFVHKLLSPYKAENGYIKGGKALLHHNRTSAPPTRCQSARPEEPKYYRPNRTHQYLSATELRDQSQNEVNLRYGRPTRTTLLRARQRSNSAPVNAYEQRRELTKRAEDSKGNSVINTSREFVTLSTWEGESPHSFLTGARYNRAHLLDSKSLSVYGVYMPRNNPLACFVTGAAAKLRDYTDDVPSAPPDTPRSDIDEFSIPLTPTSPYRTGTSHSKILPSTPTTPSSRPRSAWGDATITCHIGDDAVEDDARERALHEFVGNLNVKGNRVYVSFNSNKNVGRPSDTKLPQVKGVALPRFNKPRDPVEETSLVNQPPPTPIALSARDDRTRQDSMSLRNQYIHKEDPFQDINEDLVEDDNKQRVDNDAIGVNNPYQEENDKDSSNPVQAQTDGSNRLDTHVNHEKDTIPEEHVDDTVTMNDHNEPSKTESIPVPSGVDDEGQEGASIDKENQPETDMVLEDANLNDGEKQAPSDQDVPSSSEKGGVVFFITEDKEESGETIEANVTDEKNEGSKEEVPQAEEDSVEPETS